MHIFDQFGIIQGNIGGKNETEKNEQKDLYIKSTKSDTINILQLRLIPLQNILKKFSTQKFMQQYGPSLLANPEHFSQIL
jgi:hypothetical protein